MKHVAEIKRFLTGIVSSPSEADIPIDAASYSLNVDPSIADGKLGGVPADSTKKTSADADSMALLEADSTWDLIYTDLTAGQIEGIADFYGTPAVATFTGSQTISPTIAHPPIEVWNKAAHIGMGPDENDPPKFVGYIDHNQLDGSAPTGLQIEDAEIKAPNTAPALYKVIRTEDGTFGIEWQGQYLYHISGTGVITRSAKIFGSTQGICIDEANSERLWVYDNDGNTGYGLLYKIDNASFMTDTLTPEDYITLTAKIESWDGGDLTDTTDRVSDIHNSSGKMWYGVYRPTNITTTSLIVLISDKPITTGALVTTTDITFGFTAGAVLGQWAATPDITTYKTCFFEPQGGGAYAGWMAHFNNVGIYVDGAGPTSYAFTNAAVIFSEAFVTGGFGTTAAPRQLQTSALAKIDAALEGVSESDSAHATDGLLASFVSATDGVDLYHFDHTNTVGGGALGAGAETAVKIPAQVESALTTIGDNATVAAYKSSR